MNQQSSENEVTENLNNLSLSSNETETKPKRGRPSKPNVKNQEGKYLCKMKYDKDKYNENSTKIIAKTNELQKRYREGYNALKELVLSCNIEIPEYMKEKINKIICI
jgi:hypothetical protein